MSTDVPTEGPRIREVAEVAPSQAPEDDEIGQLAENQDNFDM